MVRWIIGGVLLSLPIAITLLSAAFTRAAWRANRTGQLTAVLIPGAALVGLLAAFFVVLVLWFGYTMSHTGKTTASDLKLALATCLPFYGVACGLWYVVRRTAPPQEAGKKV